MLERIKLSITSVPFAGEHRAKDIVIEGLERIPDALYYMEVQSTDGKNYEIKIPEDAESVPIDGSMAPLEGFLKVMLLCKSAAGDVIEKSKTENFRIHAALMNDGETLPDYKTVKSLAEKVLAVPEQIQEFIGTIEEVRAAGEAANEAAARAEQVADGSAVEQLKTDLAPYIKEIENANWLNLEACESGNIDINTGKVVPTDALRLSDYIPAKKDDIIRSYYVGTNGMMSSVSVVRYFFEFDANKNLLLRSENIPSNPYTVVNAETAYVRSCYAAQVFELSPMLFINPTEFPPTEYVAYSSGREVNIASKTQISEIKDELNLCTAKSSELERQIDYLNDNSIKVLEYTPSDIEKIDGGYINAVSGKVGSNESYFYTNPY